MDELYNDYEVDVEITGLTGDVLDYAQVLEKKYPMVVIDLMSGGVKHSLVYALQNLTKRDLKIVSDVKYDVTLVIKAKENEKVLGTITPYQVANLYSIIQDVDYEVYVSEDEQIDKKNLFALGV